MKNKVAVVVGASSGMGRSIATTFAASGAELVLAARREVELETLANELDCGALVCPTDVRDVSEVDRLIERSLAVYGRIDVLVYATGTNIPERSLETITHETWDMMLATNITGAFNCTKAVLPAMQSQADSLA